MTTVGALSLAFDIIVIILMILITITKTREHFKRCVLRAAVPCNEAWSQVKTSGAQSQWLSQASAGTLLRTTWPAK